MGRRISQVAMLAVVSVAGLLAASGCSVLPSSASTPRTSAPASPASKAHGPNVVMVLADDLTWNLLQYMPNVRRMQADGVTFSNYVVADSLCCPSRASLLTGRFAHNTGVFTNAGTDGGFRVFHDRGLENDTFATRLEASGYATGLMGKYLNGYAPAAPLDSGKPYVPPGWTEWAATGNGYPNYGYTLNENGVLRPYGTRPEDYLVTVLSQKAQQFVTKSAAARTPFALEISTFTPHAPAVPAPGDESLAAYVKAPRGRAFDKVPTNAPAWLRNRIPLTAAEKRHIDGEFRKRVRSVAAIDRMVFDLRRTLTAAGVADDTYVIFTSDNGFHMGEHRLTPGKQTAFDTDVRVPLIVVGPDVPAGVRRPEIVQNIDLAPTFAELAGLPGGDMDGRSLLPLLRRADPLPASDWRQVALIEHHHPQPLPDDPDRQTSRSAFPPTYNALRTADYLYVEYDTGEREFYDRRTDPYELHNVVDTVPPDRAAALHAAIAGLISCKGAQACLAAASDAA